MERKTQGEPAAARRRRRQEPVAAVAALHRVELAHGVAGEVLAREDAPARPAGADDLVGHRPAVEAARPLARHPPQGGGQLRLDQPRAGRQRPAVRQEDRGRRRVARQLVVREREQRDVAVGQLEAPLGEGDRRPDQRVAIEGPVALARVLEPGDAAGHPHREVAERARPGTRRAQLVEVHPLGRGTRRGLAKVEEGRAAVGEADRHEAAAAEVARDRVDHGERVAHGHCRVDRVAAMAEDIDPDLGREAVGADHHAVARGDRGGRDPGARQPDQARERDQQDANGAHRMIQEPGAARAARHGRPLSTAGRGSAGTARPMS